MLSFLRQVLAAEGNDLHISFGTLVLILVILAIIVLLVWAVRLVRR